MPTEAIPNLVDLTGVEPSHQHHLFLRAFLALTPGETFELRMDRDPDGLLYPIRLIYAGELDVRIQPPAGGVWTALVRRRPLTGRLGKVSI
jgi:uncharacterized protein (DUF2249 family)